eukprot:TRINITY_DN1833_c0_g1_i2.p1 TRINITY_DN1833_c0_g1~~TRINITY_DN1833_c0_g1_i2.p1  ORF type:complete len:354 (+),score=90.96 TRINITY_DN1833_c0_g1_i2:1-1062(+)
MMAVYRPLKRAVFHAKRLLATHAQAQKHWAGNANAIPSMQTELPSAAITELTDWVEQAMTTTSNPDETVVTPQELPNVTQYVKDVERNVLVNGPGLAMIQPVPSLADDMIKMRFVTFALTSCLGEPLVQNAAGQRSILVYDRDASRKMVDGQRYHQSHEGGSLHTDNVNVPDTWEYMFLTCLQPAVSGGDSILVSAFDVHAYLQEHHPDVVETLQEDFLWELRGFGDRFYTAPILFRNNRDEPCFRWLREYLESAHERAQQPLTTQQQVALETLTATTELPELQLEYTLKKGEIMFANDMQVFHGRTTFYDADPAEEEYNFARGVNRLLQRNWVATATTEYRGSNQSRYAYWP